MKRVALWVIAAVAVIGMASNADNWAVMLCLAAGFGWAAVIVVRRMRYFRFVRSWDGVGLRPAVTVLTERARWWSVCAAMGLDRTSDRWVPRFGRSAAASRVRVFPVVGSISVAPFGATVIVHGVPGQALSDWLGKAPALAAALRVPMISVTEPRPGVFALALRTSDPLSGPLYLDGPVDASPGIWALPLGLDELGGGLELPLANVAGVLIGGIPGSGKSAYLGFALAGYAARPDAQLVIVDGRCGHDHDVLAPRCWRYIAGDAAHDLFVVRDALALSRR